MVFVWREKCKGNKIVKVEKVGLFLLTIMFYPSTRKHRAFVLKGNTRTNAHRHTYSYLLVVSCAFRNRHLLEHELQVKHRIMGWTMSSPLSCKQSLSFATSAYGFSTLSKFNPLCFCNMKNGNWLKSQRVYSCNTAKGRSKIISWDFIFLNYFEESCKSWYIQTVQNWPMFWTVYWFSISLGERAARGKKNYSIG